VIFDPGAATHLDVVPQAATQTAGSSFNATLTARDAHDNVATGYTGTVHFTSTDGQASLPADTAFAPADAGVKSFAVTLKTAGSQTVAATDTVTSSVTGNAAVTVNPAAVSASTSTVSASPTSRVADDSTTSTVTVTLKDAYGNAVPGKTVSLSQGGASSTVATVSDSTDAA